MKEKAHLPRGQRPPEEAPDAGRAEPHQDDAHDQEQAAVAGQGRAEPGARAAGAQGVPMENHPHANREGGASASPVPPQFGPLSIQAAALVKSIEGLSTIFWISFAGVFLSIFFASLNQLDANANTDYLFLGEYQIPKSFMPPAAVAFAVFVFWLTSNRLKVLELALNTTSLPDGAVREIFRLNPPVLNVFHAENVNPWSPTNGVSVLIIAWAVFYGNSAAIIWSSALQQGASLGQFDLPQIGAYLLLIIAAIFYGVRSIIPPIKGILGTLHNVSFQLGWPRHVLAVVVATAVFLINHWEQFDSPGEQPDHLLGPSTGNAIDGETLLLRGTEVRLFGIDAMEANQLCQDREGKDYPCGRLATQALQTLLQQNSVVCLPLFAISDHRVVANCEIVRGEAAAPLSPRHLIDDHRPDNLSRLMVAQGHALAIGIGTRFFGTDQDEAQTQRRGVWRGSFQPPSVWRHRPGGR